MQQDFQSPLFDHDLDEPTVFTPEALIEAVRKERGQAAAPLPTVCVLDFDGDLTDWLIRTRGACPCEQWACFHTQMSVLEVDGVPCGIIPRTIGGPYAVLVAEQLAASRVGVIIGLTSSGRVLPSLPIPSFVVATSAVRDEGTSHHYLPPAPSAGASTELADDLAGNLRAVGLPVFRGPVWTTDAPYRETRGQFARHAAAGVMAVEMQAASLFAFAAARGAEVGVVAHVTNAIDHDGKEFDKGEQTDSLLVFRSLCRAGLHFLERRQATGGPAGGPISEPEPRR